MRRLAKPIDALRLHYDVIVIGSGYGGGVAASRLARCGKSVCVLERGKEFLPGDFPERLAEIKAELQISQGKLHAGARTALFDLRLGEDMHVLAGCGLGGGSLIGANVCLQPEPRVFDDPVWPDEIRQDDALQEGYVRAAQMLRPVSYPADRPLAKLSALENSARKLGLRSTRPGLTISFKDALNAANVPQKACTGCGDCVTGCNVGAKTTVNLTYLADAVSFGAEIFTETEVRYLRRDGDKWRVSFTLPGRGREKFGASELFIWADMVVLAAGTLGTTEILLRSRDRGLALSDQLGRHVSGNGEVLGFSFNNEIRINSVGVGSAAMAQEDGPGPSTTGIIELRGTAELAQGIVIQEGAFPTALTAVLVAQFAGGEAEFSRASDLTFADVPNAAQRILQSQLLGPRQGAVSHTQVLVASGHDQGRGQLVLEGDRLNLHYADVAKELVFAHAESHLEMAAAANGGRYTRKLFERAPYEGKPLTFSPLGGARIGRDRLSGVVNHKCQVFDGAADTAVNTVHEGLYVCDGSIVPRALGAHPLLTITALAERAMIHLALDHGLRFKTGVAAAAPVEVDTTPSGAEFAERLSGFISTTELGDYQEAAQAGEAARTPLAAKLTMLVDNVATFLHDARHAARVFGTVQCPVLSREPMEISHGTFKVLRVEQEGRAMRHFDYRMTLTARESGAQFFLAGHKVVPDRMGPDLWESTMRLNVDILRGRKGQGGRMARGVLSLRPADFFSQLRTIRGTAGRDVAERRRAAAVMGEILAGPLYGLHGAMTVPAVGPGRGQAHLRRDLRLMLPENHDVTTEDDLWIRLARYKGGDRGVVLLVHDIATSSQIFALDTLETSLLEYLCAAGYDCWVLDYRASADLPYGAGAWQFDDVARFDLPAAVDRVQAITGHGRIQVVAQGVGGMVTMMAMIRGLSGIAALVGVQSGFDVVPARLSQRMAAFGRLARAYAMLGAGAVNPLALPQKGVARLLDGAAAALAATDAGLSGESVVSPRFAALFGALYNRDEVSMRTRAFGLPRLLGPVGLEALRHWGRILRRGHLVEANGGDSYQAGFASLNLPICLIHGSRNACLAPAGARQTYERLVAIHGRGRYEHHVIRDYGHLDSLIGSQADRDVFPIILKFLERTRRS